MKKIKLVLILIISMFVCTYKANASISLSQTALLEGETFTATVSFTAASWEVHMSANGPVTGCIINEANASENNWYRYCNIEFLG